MKDWLEHKQVDLVRIIQAGTFAAGSDENSVLSVGIQLVSCDREMCLVERNLI